VEAPGTAPGSEWFISTAIYFHSRRTGSPNIGPFVEKDSAPENAPRNKNVGGLRNSANWVGLRDFVVLGF